MLQWSFLVTMYLSFNTYSVYFSFFTLALAYVADNYYISVSDSTEYDVMLKSGNYASIPSDTTFGGSGIL